MADTCSYVDTKASPFYGHIPGSVPATTPTQRPFFYTFFLFPLSVWPTLDFSGFDPLYIWRPRIQVYNIIQFPFLVKLCKIFSWKDVCVCEVPLSEYHFRDLHLSWYLSHPLDFSIVLTCCTWTNLGCCFISLMSKPEAIVAWKKLPERTQEKSLRTKRHNRKHPFIYIYNMSINCLPSLFSSLICMGKKVKMCTDVATSVPLQQQYRKASCCV